MKDQEAVFVSFVIERNDDGYLASVPSIQSAFAEGDSMEEAIFNCVDVLKMIFAYRNEIAARTFAMAQSSRLSEKLASAWKNLCSCRMTSR